MILRTGWTREQLRAQPAALVEALIWRLFAERVWRPDLAEAAAGPAPPLTDTRARNAYAAAREAVARLRSLLFEEEDG